VIVKQDHKYCHLKLHYIILVDELSTEVVHMNKIKFNSVIKNLKNRFSSIPALFVIVDSSEQMIHLIKNKKVIKSYSVSTAKKGMGNKEGSNQTPAGIHSIGEKIGNGAPKKRIFLDRKDTGIDWDESMSGENKILTRILRLRGLEPGVNSGPGIDSWERYIYIHGTNREDLIGTPMSHGCVCMRNKDVIDFFNSVPEDTIVVID